MKKIEINYLDDLNDGSSPMYVLVAGGIATGKSHVVGRFIKTIEVIDVDNFMSKFNYTNYDPKGEQFRHAMEETAAYIKTHKAGKKSMVAMGTASNFEFAKFRLDEAKQDGYRTAILHVVTPTLGQAYAQNEMRRMNNERAVAREDLEILSVTANNSDETVSRILRDHPEIVDFYTPYVNEFSWPNKG